MGDHGSVSGTSVFHYVARRLACVSQVLCVLPCRCGRVPVGRRGSCSAGLALLSPCRPCAVSLCDDVCGVTVRGWVGRECLSVSPCLPVEGVVPFVQVLLCVCGVSLLSMCGVCRTAS